MPRKKASDKMMDRILDKMRSRFKDQSVSLLEDSGAIWEPKLWVPTDVLAFQAAIGAKGLPTGKIIEIQGYESAGKSTLLDQLIASFQRRGHYAVLIDTEFSRQIEYLKTLGVDPSKLILIQEQTIEGIGERIQALINEFQTQGVPEDRGVIIGWDTIANTPSRAEAAGYEARASGKKQSGGLQEAARALKEMFRAITHGLADINASLVCTNQFYQKIGPFAGRETYGGTAMKYMPSVRVEVVKTGGKAGLHADSLGIPRGHYGELRCHKNKLRDPHKRIPYLLTYGFGYDNVFTVMSLLESNGMIGRSGPWFEMEIENFEGIKAHGSAQLRKIVDERISTTPEFWDAMLEEFWKLLR